MVTSACLATASAIRRAMLRRTPRKSTRFHRSVTVTLDDPAENRCRSGRLLWRRGRGKSRFLDGGPSRDRRLTGDRRLHAATGVGVAAGRGRGAIGQGLGHILHVLLEDPASRPGPAKTAQVHSEFPGKRPDRGHREDLPALLGPVAPAARRAAALLLLGRLLELPDDRSRVGLGPAPHRPAAGSRPAAGAAANGHGARTNRHLSDPAAEAGSRGRGPLFYRH